jgi:uncharacterized protein YeaO (DUF488 family)
MMIMSKLQNSPTGNLFTSNPAGLINLNVEAELWQITRGGVQLPNTLLVKNLSPSKTLFLKFVHEWKGYPYDEWWHKYERLFLKELSTEEKLRGLRDVYKRLLLGKNVVLICFCHDHRFCHRRLVAEFFEPYGVKAKELNPIKVEQLSIFQEESHE